MCDEILANMETMLCTFQEDLGQLSAEIETLQEQSLTMNVKLSNRKQVQSALDEFVHDVAVPPPVIKRICEEEVNEAYLEYLMVLSDKMAFLETDDVRQSRARRDVMPEVEKLRVKATEKIRSFLLERIRAAGRPNARYGSYEIVQQNMLLKFMYFNRFLIDHSPAVAAEVRSEYTEVMSQMYARMFKQYLANLLKLRYESEPDRDDVIGAEEGAKRTLFSSKPVLKETAGVFTLGDRADVLHELEAPVIIPSVARQRQQRFPHERLFRSFHYALLDNATSERSFVVDFFQADDAATIEIFNGIFRPSLNVYLVRPAPRRVAARGSWSPAWRTWGRRAAAAVAAAAARLPWPRLTDLCTHVRACRNTWSSTCRPATMPSA